MCVAGPGDSIDSTASWKEGKPAIPRIDIPPG